MSAITFTSHNIRLDDGTLTKPDEGVTIDRHHLMLSAKRVLDTVFPGDKSRYRLADLGCLEGGYAVEFARMGFRVLGLEVRESNFAACSYVKSRTALPNLAFVRDDAWNIAKYGRFDVMFCCGLFYHLDRPRVFLQLISEVTSKVLLLYTHFATERVRLEDRVRWVLGRSRGLSPLTVHEGLSGRWFVEFGSERALREREAHRWASWDNRRSFWMRREYLLDAIRDAGFDLVIEQFDCLGPGIAGNMLAGDYYRHNRGTFVGVKTDHSGRLYNRAASIVSAAAA